jgi:hypothetical protein
MRKSLFDSKAEAQIFSIILFGFKMPIKKKLNFGIFLFKSGHVLANF